MIKLIRKFITSKIGVFATLAFLVVIALAFGLSSVSNQGSFGGVSGADQVAIVGGSKISTSELSRAVTQNLNLARQRQPTITMESFVANGGFDQALQQVIDTAAFSEFGRKIGLRAGSRLVDSEIAQTAAFQGADGKFDENAYRSRIAQLGMSDKEVRHELSSMLLARQVSTPVGLGTGMPLSLAKRYASLLEERRKGSFGILPSAAYMPQKGPTDEQLAAYYKDHRTDYLRPERREIRYAVFGADAVGKLPAPTEAEIAARYKRDQAQYEAAHLRRLSTLVLPTQAAAQAVKDEVAKGKSLEAAAEEKGLRVAQTGFLKQDELAQRDSAEVAKEAFVAAKGKIAGPVKAPLGFYLLRVDEIQDKPGRSLDQVRGEIAKALETEKRQQALADLTTHVEDELDGGDSLAEVAKGLKLKITTTPPLTADGKVYGKPGQTAPAVLARALSTAFAMDEGNPELAEITPNTAYLVYEVGKITPSAAAPLDEIKDTVALAWKKDEGNKAAKQAAERVMERLAKGEDLLKAMREEKKPLPPPSKVNLTREDLTKIGNRVPSVLALMFSMAQDTVKRLEAPNQNGWFVVKLDTIEPGKLKDSDPLLTQAQRELGQLMGDEYNEEFLRAMENEVGVEKHQPSIDAVKAQLTGRNQL
jgi:peptidyl-prolyl cis-trans isomerase D